MTTRHVTLRAAVQPAEIRTATRLGQEVLVVPVVALVGDSVIRPLGSAGPEFVPASVLSALPQGWDGRPVIPDHPDGPRPVNEQPELLDALQFGQVFATRFEGNGLKMEAWLDPVAAARVGEAATSVLDACRAGRVVEVSIGAWITARPQAGTAPDGTPYETVWTSVESEHLAIGLNGAEGACSIDMGCGAPRAATTKEKPTMPETRKPIFTRMLAALGRFRGGQEEMSVSDLERALWEALYAEEPGLAWIDDVFPDTVIYSVDPEGSLITYRRGYTVSGDDHDVTLATDREAVEAVVRYEPAGAEPACTCGASGDDEHTDQPGGSPTTTEGEAMTERVKELVGRLIANARAPFATTKEDTLAALGEEALESLDKRYAAEDEEPEDEPEEEHSVPPLPNPNPPADPDPEPVPPEEATVALKRAEYEKIKASADAFHRLETARHAGLVAELKPPAQDGFTVAELEAMSNDQLVKLARALRREQATNVDYSLRGMPDPTGGQPTSPSAEPPRPYTRALEKSRQSA